MKKKGMVNKRKLNVELYWLQAKINSKSIWKVTNDRNMVHWKVNTAVNNTLKKNL